MTGEKSDYNKINMIWLDGNNIEGSEFGIFLIECGLSAVLKNGQL